VGTGVDHGLLPRKQEVVRKRFLIWGWLLAWVICGEAEVLRLAGLLAWHCLRNRTRIVHEHMLTLHSTRGFALYSQFHFQFQFQ